LKILSKYEKIEAMDLEHDDIKKNKDYFNALTLVKLNYEPEANKLIFHKFDKNFFEEKKIKDIFNNHVFLEDYSI